TSKSLRLMKYLTSSILLFVLLLPVISVAQAPSLTNPNYDSTLAKQLGADEYGMKQYVLVILKTGPNKTTDKTFISEQFKGHMENIDRLVKEKKLIVAGPLKKNEKTYRGIFILDNLKGIEESAELLQTDPAIKSGLLEPELFIWYGSAALPQYLEDSDKIWTKSP